MLLPDRFPDEEFDGTARVDAAVEAGDLVSEALKKYQAGDIDGAVAAARRAQAIDPQSSSAYELEALFVADIGDQSRQIEALRGVLATHRDVPHLQSAAGRMLIRAGAVEEGLAAMEHAVRLAPQTTEYARDLAGMHVDLGNLPAAIGVLTAAQQHHPQDAQLAVALARLHESAGNWDRALVYYTATLQREPRNSAWRRQRARCLYRLEEYERAATEFQRCQETDVACLTFADRIEFGDSCLRMGDVERASQIFSELSQEGIATRELTILSGICELHRGNRKGAEAIFSEAARRWPDDPSIALFLNTSRGTSGGVLPASGTR
jgi:tetratricopeptide (TPR) repeat protein